MTRQLALRGNGGEANDWLELCAGAETGGGGDSVGHAGCVVGEAEAAVGAEKDDSAVAAETVVEVFDGFIGGQFGWCAVHDAVSGPLAEDELHDGFTPAGERDSGGEIVSVAAATD